MRFTTALAAVLLCPALAGAQLVLPKTVPVAIGEQFQIFPSSNGSMGGVGIALPDSLLDPWVNPANAAHMRASRIHGAPLFYSVSNDGGSGRTLPVGMIGRSGPWSAGVLAALQQLESGNRLTWWGAQPVSDRSSINHYAAGTVGRALTNGWTAGASLFVASLTGMDAVDLLYGIAERVDQSGGLVEGRVGVARELPGDRWFELLALHQRFGMRHDVRYREWVPGPTQNDPWQMVTRDELNEDRTHTWGLHSRYVRPLNDEGWHLGWIATANRHSHPKIPNYEIMSIPRDPGTSYAFNFGMGVGRRVGPLTFGLDWIYEPIWSDTWADAEADTAAAGGGVIPKGGKTVENYFEFNNSTLRIGVGRDAEFGSAHDPKALGVNFGVAARAIRYRLEQTNNVEGTFRRQWEDWMEWTPTWGVTLRFTELSIAYSGRTTSGVGRPGVWGGFPCINCFRTASDARGGGIIVAPGEPIVLQPARVAAHQVSFSLPLR